MFRNNRLLLLLAFGALVRVLMLMWFYGQPLYIHDERDYNEIAVNLARANEFALTSGYLTSIRPPLYPCFVSVLYRVFGVENFDSVRIAQSILSLGNVVLLHRLAAGLFSRRVAGWAAALLCFYPSLLWSTCLLLTETVFTFWLLVMCLCLQRILVGTLSVPTGPHAECAASYDDRPHRSWHLVLLGVSLGLGALTRSVLWLFPPFLLVYLWFVDDSKDFRSRLTILALPVIGFVLTIAPWSIRNTRLQQTFTTIDVMGGRNVMMGNYEHTPLFRAWDAISIGGDKSWNAVLSKELAGKKLTQGQRDKAAMRYGIRYVLQHPGLTFRRCAIKFCNFWQLERSIVSGGLMEWWRIESRWMTIALAALVMGFYAISILLGIFGYILFPPSDWRMHWFFLLLIAFVCAVHTAVFGHSRYHVPLMPLILMYSASALVHFRSSDTIPARERKDWRFALASGICVCLIASWVFEFVVVDLPRIGSLG